MSHNINKVNTNEPDIGGDISPLSLSNLITVNSPTDGEYLIKAATDWQTSTLTEQQKTAGFSIDRFGTYSVSTYYYRKGYNYIFFKGKTNHITSAFSYVNSTGSYVPVANNSWWQALKAYKSALEGKTIILEASIAPFANTSMKAEVQWVRGYGSSYTPIGPPSIVQGQGHADMIYGRFVYNSSLNSVENLTLKIRYLSATNHARLSGGVRHMAETVVLRVLD